MAEATDEKRTAAVSGVVDVAWCTCAAATALGNSNAARRHACTPSIRPLSPRPAACSTPSGRTSAASAAASAASPPSHATTVVAPPDRSTARSDASRPCPPRATKPLRDVSTSRAAPRDASIAAPRSPSPPSPPVTSHAPAATPPDAEAASTPRRRSRAPWRRPPAQATSDSALPPPPDDAASNSSAQTAAAALASRGTSALSTRTDGCSRRSTRAKPQLPPCAAADSAPAHAPHRTATAPLVRSSSGGGGAVRYSNCARRTADCTPRTHGATPSAASSSSATPRHARPPTAPPGGSLTSCTGVDRDARIASAAPPSAPAGFTASHWPPGDDAAGAAGSAQPRLYRAMAELSGAFSAAVAQGKARRRKRSAPPPPTADAAVPGVHCSTACATVPLYPNDDKPPTSPTSTPGPIAARPVGSAHAAPPRSASPTRRLSRRSCAFGAASPRASPAASTSSPAIAAAGSACPAFALTLPTASGAGASPRACTSTACNEPASIGSPSAVPVPCASSRATPTAATPASASAACSSARCAVPLGAVRLALRPSCRTALPRTTIVAPIAAPNAGCSTVAPHASPRT
eukprot:scaffold30060_cov60-Phaeocystis_antarctica.AAC.2